MRGGWRRRQRQSWRSVLGCQGSVEAAVVESRARSRGRKLCLDPPSLGRQQMTSRHRPLGEQLSVTIPDPISAHKTDARRRTQTQEEEQAGRCQGGVGTLRLGGFLVHRARASGIGSPRPGRIRFQQGSAIEGSVSISLGALALQVSRLSQRDGWKASLTGGEAAAAAALLGGGLGKAARAMATLVDS